VISNDSSPIQSTNSLSLLLLNSQSIVSKKASLDCLLSEHNPHILAVTETWLKPDIPSSELLPSEYSTFRKDRPGGVLLACHNSLNCKILNIDTVSEVIACQLLFDNHESLIVCVFYRPPNRSPESVSNLCNYFKSIVQITTLIHLSGLLGT